MQNPLLSIPGNLNELQRPSKKRKLAEDGKASKSKTKGKERASDRATIPIPRQGDQDDVELSEDDLGMLDEFGGAVSFLTTLDEKGIARCVSYMFRVAQCSILDLRSKKETERLHQSHTPARKAAEDDLPSIDSHSEDEDEEWSSGIDAMSADDMSGSEDEADSVAGSSSAGAQRKRRRKQAVDSEDEELPFESQPRKRHSSWEPESDTDKGIERLPIKLANGRIQKSGSKIVLDQSEESGLESDDESAHEEVEDTSRSRVEDVSTGARFGRPAVVDVIGQKSRKARIQGAKEQIAGLCQEILGDPENSVWVSSAVPRHIGA